MIRGFAGRVRGGRPAGKARSPRTPADDRAGLEAEGGGAIEMERVRDERS